MAKAVQKITAIILATAISTDALAFTTKQDEHNLIGTPEQIEIALNNKFQEIVPNAHFEEIDEKEDLKVASRIATEIKVYSDIPYTFSLNFDNREGPVLDRNSIKRLIWTLFDRKISKAYNKALAKYATFVPKNLTNAQVKKIFSNALELADSSISGSVEGFACPMGGSPAKNKSLSLLRAESLKEIVAEAVREYFMTRFNYEFTEDELKSKISAAGKGSIYRDDRVKKICDALNEKGYKIDYKKIAAEDEQEIIKFDRAIKQLKSTNPAEFESLKKSMDSLRKVVLRLDIAVDAKSYIVPIIFVEKDVIPGVIPQQWKIDEARKRAVVEAHEVLKPVVNYIRTRRPNIPRAPKGARGAFAVK